MEPHTIEVSEETIDIIRSLQRDGEAFEETIKRLALAFRVGGFMAYDPTRQCSKSDT